MSDGGRHRYNSTGRCRTRGMAGRAFRLMRKLTTFTVWCRGVIFDLMAAVNPLISDFFTMCKSFYGPSTQGGVLFWISRHMPQPGVLFRFRE